MTIEQYLSAERKEMPGWLKAFRPGDRIKPDDFFGSGVLYYPGCGDDRQPLETFNRSRCCHCYVYADYGHDKAEVVKSFGSFEGYNLLATVNLTEKDIVSNWTQHYTLSDDDKNAVRGIPVPVHKPFGMYFVFERKPECDDSIGCERFALLYLCADGIAAYDAIFANGLCRDFSLVVQDHGFGGNYSTFGNGGVMHRIAKETGTLPKLILCAKDSEVWYGYRDLNLEPVTGGMHMNERLLYRRDTI